MSLNELAKKGRDANLNAAPFYEKAAGLYVREAQEISFQEFPRWPSELTDSHRLLLEQWVRSNTEALAQLTLGTQKPYYWAQCQASTTMDWFDAAAKHVKEDVFLGRALIFRAMLDSMNGDPARGTQKLLACRRLGLHLTGTPSLLEYVVGMMILDHTAHAASLIIAKTDADQSAMESLRSALSKELSENRLAVFDFLEGERIRMLELVQRAFVETRDDSRLKHDEEIELALAQKLTWDQMEALDLRRGKTIQDIEAGVVYCRRFLLMSPWERKAKGLAFREDHARLTRENPLVRAFTFDGVGVARGRDKYAANVNALITTLGLMRYKKERGALPVDLEELVSKGYLSALPIDPYSGKPFVYKQTGDDFMLYSLGEDFDDDGGKHSDWGRGEQGGDYVFWPVQAK